MLLKPLEGPPSQTEPLHLNRGEGMSFGTFGELLQGALPGHAADFLVTFPVELYSRAVFTPHGASQLSVFPERKQKALRLVHEMLMHYQLPCRGHLEIHSQIPEGKGLASSSADMVAAARAVAQCFHLPLGYAELEMFLRRIEPTDGVMYPGVSAFYHRRVELREFFGPLPPLTVLSIDEGGIIDTVEFNRKRRDYSQAHKEEYQVLLNELKRCLASRDLEGLGQVTTRSAELNQLVNPKRHFQRLVDVSRDVHALGVVVAHSGTCVGVLFSREDPARREKMELCTARLSDISPSIEIYESWQGVANGGLNDSPYNTPLWFRCG